MRVRVRVDSRFTGYLSLLPNVYVLCVRRCVCVPMFVG